MLAVFENLYAVYEDVLHPNSVLVRFFECRAIRNRCRIKDHHVSKHSLLNESAMIQAEIRGGQATDRKSTRLNSSHITISYAVFCLKKKKKKNKKHKKKIANKTKR